MTYFATIKGTADAAVLRGLWRAAALCACVLGGSACFAQSELTRYISPDVPVLAGMHAVPTDQGDDLMWLATKNNAADLAQMVKVTGDDPGRQLEEVIATDSASRTGSLGNHLLLAKGRFDANEITTAEQTHGARTMKYRGIPVLVLDAPQDSLPGLRWFAVLKHEVAMLGTPEAVAQALNRSIDDAEADARIEARLRNIPRKDVAWSSIAIGSGAVRTHLARNAAGIRSCLGSTGEFVLGIHPGSTMEIDMKTIGANGAAACLSNSIFGGGARLVRVGITTSNGAMLKVKLHREEYQRWLNSFRGGRTDEMLEAMVGTVSATDGER